jgi:DNA repair protein RecN (Recombination protein N)
MIASLMIQNFGLIDRLSIDLSDHLNILTGETGAGKSIIIDALRYVLGERLESSLVRDPKQPCLVQATFELTTKELRDHPLFADYLQGGESQLIIERVFQPDGRSKIKINGLALTLGQLKDIGNHLIDFHGAHDHQMLLQESQHIVMLDQLAKAQDVKSEYLGSFSIYSELCDNLQALIDLSKTNRRDFDLLAHQIKELERVPLEEAEFEKIEQEQIKINNSEKLNTCVEQILGIFEDEDNGVDGMIRKAFGPLRTLNQVDETTGQFTDRLTSAQENIQDFLSSLRSYADSLSFDAQAAQEINNRYDIYQDIKRKYGPTLAEAKEFYTQGKEKFDLLNNFEHNDAELREKIDAQKKELAKIAQKITKKRQTAAQDLKSTIEKELKELGINHVEFEVRIEKIDFNKDGQDRVVFYISPNAGEELKPLAQIVSSGEAARVMLALKKALINVDTIPVLIFDEIDAQIGGRLGTITGKKLKELARDRQVILITHLPQIASFADIHFKIFKSVKAGRAITQVSQLDETGRVKEIAEMMSGQSKSEISISHAEDMLSTARKTKISTSKV